MIKKYDDITTMVEEARKTNKSNDVILTLNELWALRIAQEVKGVRNVYKYKPLCVFTPEGTPIFVGVIFDTEEFNERDVDMRVVTSFSNGIVPSDDIIVVREDCVGDKFFKGDYTPNRMIKKALEETVSDIRN